MGYRVSIVSDDRCLIAAVRQAFRDFFTYELTRSDVFLLDHSYIDKPDVLLLDSRIDGILHRCALLDGASTRLIFLAVPNDAWALDALAVGARGIIRSTEPVAVVSRATPAVLAGEVWASRQLLTTAWLRVRAEIPSESRGAALEHRLSPRQRDVVRFVAAGLSNKELADRLGISTATVKNHMTTIFHKLGVQGRGPLTAAYYRAVPGSSTRRES
jgi:DNA-binding NarL/FixJ family response regulator